MHQNQNNMFLFKLLVPLRSFHFLWNKPKIFYLSCFCESMKTKTNLIGIQTCSFLFFFGSSFCEIFSSLPTPLIKLFFSCFCVNVFWNTEKNFIKKNCKQSFFSTVQMDHDCQNRDFVIWIVWKIKYIKKQNSLVKLANI